MKKLFLFILMGMFMISLASSTWSNNTFNNSLTSENMTILDLYNTTRYLDVPEDIVLTNATLDLDGFEIDKGTQIGFAEFSQSETGLAGITSNGTFIWVADNVNKTIDKYDMNYVFTGDSIDVSSEYAVGGIRGITTNGTFIWSAESSTSNVYKYYINGTYTGDSFTVGSSVQDLSSNETHIFTDTLASPGQVQVYDMDGNFVNQFFVSFQRYGVAYSEGYLYISSSNSLTNKYTPAGASFGSFSFPYNASNNVARAIHIQDDSMYVIQSGTNDVYIYNFEDRNITDAVVYVNNTPVYTGSGDLVVSTSISNFASTVNDYLSGCTYSNGLCNVPIKFQSANNGYLEYSNLNFNTEGFIDNCAVNNRELLYYELVDEEDQDLLDASGENATISIDLTIYTSDGLTEIGNYSNTFSDTNNATICIPTDLGESAELSLYSTTQYSGSDYSTEYHNIQNLTVDNNTAQQNITLYDLLSADATNFKIIYKGTNFLPVPNAIIKVQRQYVGEGAFKEVESPLTGTDGSAVAHLVRDDVNYNFVVSKDGIILATFENQVAFCEDIISENCIISLNALSGSGAIFSYEDTVKIIHSITFNTTTRELDLLFSTFDGTSKLVNFKAFKNDQLGTNSICDTSVTSSSGSLTCTVPASIGNETIYYELYVDSELVYTGFYALENPVDYGDTGIFLLLIFLLTIPLMFVDSKDLTIFAVGFVFIIAILYGFITGDILGTSSAIIWLIIQGVILIVKNNTGGSSNG